MRVQGVNESTGRACPSWPGGMAARSREAAQQPKPRRRGGCSNTADLALNHHPVCGVNELSRLFLDAAATPPGQEGQGAPCGFIHTFIDRAYNSSCWLAVMLAAVLAIPAAAQTPSAPSADGTTPLHLAVRSNDLATAQRLLRAGANPSAANRYGVTPLSLAAENGNAEMIATLLKSGANAKAALPGG